MDGFKIFDTNVKLRNWLILNLAYQKIINNKYHWTTPEQRLLNLIWEQVRDNDDLIKKTPGTRGTHLNWEGDWGYTYDANKDANDGKPRSPFL